MSRATVSSVVLPTPPDQYDVQDQREVRRQVERAFQTASQPVENGPKTYHASGVAPLTLTRDETTAAVLPLETFKRNGVVLRSLALNALDQLVVLAADGVTVLAGPW